MTQKREGDRHLVNIKQVPVPVRFLRFSQHEALHVRPRAHNSHFSHFSHYSHFSFVRRIFACCASTISRFHDSPPQARLQ